MLAGLTKIAIGIALLFIVASWWINPSESELD